MFIVGTCELWETESKTSDTKTQPRKTTFVLRRIYCMTVQKKKVFNEEQKFMSVLCDVTLAGSDRGQTFPVGLDCVCKHCRGWHWATQTFNSFHRFSIGLRCGAWLGHFRTWRCFLRCPGGVSEITVMQEVQHIPSSMLSLLESHHTLPCYFCLECGSVVLSPLQKNSPETWSGTPMLCSGYGVLGMFRSLFCPPPNTPSGFYTTYSSSILVSFDHMTSYESSSGSSRCSLASWLGLGHVQARKPGNLSNTARF